MPREVVGVMNQVIAIEDTVRGYFQGFQRGTADNLVCHIAFPYNLWYNGTLELIDNAAIFTEFRDDYMKRTKSQGFERGEIVSLQTEIECEDTAIVRMKSNRINAHHQVIGEADVLFILRRVDGRWGIWVEIITHIEMYSNPY